jgi:hypothetical protein
VVHAISLFLRSEQRQEINKILQKRAQLFIYRFPDSIRMTDAHFISADSSVSKDTLIDLLLTSNTCYSCWPRRTRSSTTPVLPLFESVHPFVIFLFCKSVNTILKCHSSVNFTSFRTLSRQKSDQRSLFLFVVLSVEQLCWMCHDITATQNTMKLTNKGEVIRLGTGISTKMRTVESRRKIKRHVSRPFVQWALDSEIQ